MPRVKLSAFFEDTAFTAVEKPEDEKRIAPFGPMYLDVTRTAGDSPISASLKSQITKEGIKIAAGSPISSYHLPKPTILNKKKKAPTKSALKYSPAFHMHT